MFSVCRIVILIFLGFSFISASEDVDEVAQFEQFLKEGTTMLVLFTKKCCTCTECVEAEVRLGGMSQNLESMNIAVVRLRKSFYRKVYGIKSVPSILFIRKGIPALYDGKIEVERIFWWVTDNAEPKTRELNDDSFEHLTQAATGATTGDWLVAFYDQSCINKNALYTNLECVVGHFRSYLNTAIVDISKSPETKSRFNIKECPEVILFKQGKMYRTKWSNLVNLRLFAEKLYQEYKAEVVPLPLTGFDKLVDSCVSVLKQHTTIVLAMVSLAFSAGVLFFILSNRPSKAKTS